jgi:hypothetical protein
MFALTPFERPWYKDEKRKQAFIIHVYYLGMYGITGNHSVTRRSAVEFVFLTLLVFRKIHIFVAAILFVEVEPSTGEFGNHAIRESVPCLQFL